MLSEVNEHEAQVQRFCSDLKMLKPSEVIRKHITTGTPVALTTNCTLRFATRSLTSSLCIPVR